MPARLRALPRLLVIVGLAAATVAAVDRWVGQVYVVEQHSMEAALREGERVIVDKLGPASQSYRGGDIVVLEAPEALGTAGLPLVKRVVATGGQTVDLFDGRVAVDGVALDEPYLAPGTTTRPETATDHWEVPAGSVFVLGDNRGVSVDSRTFGPVPVSSLVGRAVLVAWPPTSVRPLP